jgi:hypothetical protein
MASDSLTHSHIWSEHFKIALLSQLYRWSYCDSLTISTYQAHLNLWMFPLYVSSGCALLTVEILWPDESLSVLPYKCFHMKHNTTGLAIPFLWHLAVVIRVLYSTFCYCSYDMWWYISSHELTRQSFIFTNHYTLSSALHIYGDFCLILCVDVYTLANWLWSAAFIFHLLKARRHSWSIRAIWPYKGCVPSEELPHKVNIAYLKFLSIFMRTLHLNTSSWHTHGKWVICWTMRNKYMRCWIIYILYSLSDNL